MKFTGKHFFRRCLISGLVVWLPILAVFVVVRFIVRLADGLFSQVPNKELWGHHIPGLSLIFTLLVIFLTGLIVNYFAGHYIVNAWERLMMRIPVIRSIYSAVKQMIGAFTQEQGESFRKVLLIQYPREGIYTIGFQTSNRIRMPTVSDELVTVFIPTTPLPTSGFVILVAKKDVIELNISVETAFKMIVSLGVVKPDSFDIGK